MAEQRKLQEAKIEVATEIATKRGIDVAAVDCLQLMMEWDLDYHRSPITIADFHFEGITFDDEIPNFSRVMFKECIFDALFVGANVDATRLPRFNKCLIGSLDGVVALGDLSQEAFQECEVLELSSSTARNADILETDLPVAIKVLLTVLNKLFYQSGRGRKENAFSRGLESRARGLVPQVLGMVQALGFATPNRIRNQTVWLPKRDKMRRVNDMLAHPRSSPDPLIERIRNL